MSIDVGWVEAVDGKVVSVYGGRRVSVDKLMLLSIDAVRFSLWIEHSKRAGSEKRSVCSLLLPVLLDMHLKRQKKKTYQFLQVQKPRLYLTKYDLMAIEAP